MICIKKETGRTMIKKVRQEIAEQFKGYDSIALYGSGIWAERILNCAEELQLDGKVTVILDRDDSERLGETFKGRKICRLSQVYQSIDAVVIASWQYWDTISERVKAFLREQNVELPIINVFPRGNQVVSENSLVEYKEYVLYLEDNLKRKSDSFVEITKEPYERRETDTKVIAWYLPQYYQMEVNDIYHGKGFTEWTNSSRAFPLYVGHQQPHIPYDVGYYSLDNVETLKRQAELAKMYGVYGFGFHYYWFSGQRTMEKPLYMLLEHPEIDIPFCFDWATENWTSAWDGGNFDLIFEQKLQDGDDERFMADILPFFKDSRYIKIDGKPLLVIYRVSMFETSRFKKLLQNFRRIAKENGFPDLFILLTNRELDNVDAEEYGADGMVEFQPTQLCRYCNDYIVKGYLNSNYSGRIYDYADLVQRKVYMQEHKSKKFFRSALVAFDTTARKTGKDSVIFHGASPEGFRVWVKDIIEESGRIHPQQENFVFVNSWNEWAEGSHLEPDMRDGYAYLNAVKEALCENREIISGIE